MVYVRDLDGIAHCGVLILMTQSDNQFQIPALHRLRLLGRKASYDAPAIEVTPPTLSGLLDNKQKTFKVHFEFNTGFDSL